MVLLLLIPFVLAAIAACFVLTGVLIGVGLMYSRHRRIAPFFFCIPASTILGMCVFAWPFYEMLVIPLGRNSDLPLMWCFPLGGLGGLGAGLWLAFFIRSKMRRPE